MKLRFYKKNGRWFADIPNIPEDLNEMVMNSDTLLEEISLGKTAVILNIEIDEPEQYLIKMSIKEHDNEGAWYSLMGPLYNQIMTKTIAFNEIWICNVTHEVFGEHPEAIYITSIERCDALPQLQFPNAITIPRDQIPEVKMEPFNDRPMETWIDMVDLI
jgi:hypothetical protein